MKLQIKKTDASEPVERDNRTLVAQRISKMIEERKELQRKIQEGMESLRNTASIGKNKDTTEE